MQPAAKFRILVVDDSRDTAQSFALLLDAMGYEATFETDPRKALSTAADFSPQIAFIDIGMPHIDGWELARLFRRHYSDDKMRLTAVTSYGEQEDRVKSRQAGFDAHIVKPVSFELVQSIMDQFFPRR